DDLVINNDVIQSKDLNKSEELSSKVEEVLLSMGSMRVVNMARDEKIDKILESVSRIETMISQLSLNNDFETPTKLSVQKTRPFSNRLKAKSSDIDIHTTISDDEDDLIELDKRFFTHDDAFNIEINMDKPVSPTIRVTTKKKNILKDKTIMGTQKKLPFTHPDGIRKPKMEPKSFDKSKASYALSQPTKDYRRPVYFFFITNRAFDITETMKRNGRRSEQVFPLEVCIVDDRSRKHSYPKGPNKNSLPPLLSLSISQAMVVVNGWFEDEILNLRTCREPPISEDLRDLKYYM
ncbi:hypothetical protein S245_044809, partial [Arachis hypogaea]